jgi:hypothetical protein
MDNNELDLDQGSEEKKVATKKKVSRPPKRKAAGEPSRVSYKDRRKISANDQDPDFVYRVVNSDNERNSGRIDEMTAMGYKIANDGETLGDEHGVEASTVGSQVGKHVGHGTRGVLMKIPRHLYEEDQAAKQAEVDHSEAGMVADELKNADGMYGEGLKVSDNRGTRMETKVRQ